MKRKFVVLSLSIFTAIGLAGCGANVENQATEAA